MQMLKFKVVRTYDSGKDNKTDLQQAFDDGWQFVRASEFVPENKHDGIRRFGYIEYILCKEVGDADEN